MNYGHFDDARREYVITDPRTPVKWINYIGTLAFGGFVDHTGGSLLCRQDPTFNRITKYIPQLPDSDFKGTSLYLRIRQAGGYRVISPFFVPCLTPDQRFECRVGLGYTRIVSEIDGIETDATIFVPRGAAVELRDIRITNRSGAPLDLDAIPVVEYTHFDALKQFTNADWVPQTMQSDLHEAAGGVKLLAQYAFMRKGTAENYFTSNLPASSFESERQHFLGQTVYGSWANPHGLQSLELGCHQARRGDNIGALLHPLGVLQPGESRRLIVQLGQAAGGVAAAADSIERYRQPAAVDAALADLRGFWDAYLACLQVETPDPAVNSMVNIHNPRQCYTTLTWSRYLSLYQTGLGERGIGMRDSAQDILGALASAPEEAKDLLRNLLSMQQRDGSAMHSYNPLTRVGSMGDATEREDRPHYYSDDHLWPVLAATAYIKETGDFAFLDEVIPFYDKDKHEQPIESGPVSEHLRRAVAFTRGDTGAHGVPRLGFADWNDTINLAKGSESLLTANLYGRALHELIALAEARGQADEAAAWRADWKAMAEQVNRVAWDGDWWVSYFDADGTPLGSKTNAFGQIYAYGQAWPVLSGFAGPERAEQGLQALFERLNTRNGIKLSKPGFNGFDPTKGGVTTYPPGAKENGGIFLHVNPWVIVAETMLGNGSRAFQYYHQTNPAAKNDRIEEFECEPYVYPQNILGDEHPQFGLARNSWLSGTASWMYQAATQYILGIRADYAGLIVDPCLPPEWDGYQAVRRFRGSEYRITVRNPQHVSRGVDALRVDGQRVTGTLVPLAEPGRVVAVEVTLG
jgi:cellobiose phosphorylase